MVAEPEIVRAAIEVTLVIVLAPLVPKISVE